MDPDIAIARCKTRYVSSGLRLQRRVDDHWAAVHPQQVGPTGGQLRIKTLPNIDRSADFRYTKNTPVV